MICNESALGLARRTGASAASLRHGRYVSIFTLAILTSDWSITRLCWPQIG